MNEKERGHASSAESFAEDLPLGIEATSPEPGALAMAGLLDEIDVGMLLCDWQGVLIWQNAAGAREVRSAAVLTTGLRRHLICQADGLSHRLRLAIRNTARGQRALLALGEGAHRLMVSIQPFVDSVQGAHYALLLLGRRQVATELVVEMLCRLHELTFAEQRVLKALLQGLRVESIAQDFGVKVCTVRTHVASLRAKLGVRRMDDALRLAAELPPMVSALRRRDSSYAYQAA